MNVSPGKETSNEMTRSEHEEGQKRTPTSSFIAPFPFSVWWCDILYRFLHPIPFFTQGGQTQKDGPEGSLTILGT